MKNNYCVYEDETIGALQKGCVPEYLARHLSECASCRELSDIMTFLKAESILATEEARLPSADFLMWKSQLQQRQKRAKRATRPIAIMEMITPLILTCVLILIASYLNYSSDHKLLQTIGWAVIVISTMVTSTCIVAYWISAKKSIGRQSNAYLGK